MNADIPPGLWHPVVQLAVRIGWICDANETAAGGGGGGAAATFSVSALLTVAAGEAESVAVTVKLEVPAAVGVPLIAPAALNVSPAASVPVETAQV